MKILILRLSPDIVNFNTYNLQEIGLAKALIRKGHTCDVMYFGGRQNDHVEKVEFDQNRSLNVIWLHGYGFAREGFFPSLKKYLDGYDIFQVNEYCGVTACWLDRHYPNKVVHYHGPYYCKDNRGDIIKAAVFDKTLLPLSNKANLMIITKSRLAEDYLRKKGITDVTTIGVGLDADKFESETSHPELKIPELKGTKGHNILYVGRIEPRRNTLFLLDVFSKVHAADDSSRLVIIGNGEQDYVENCRKRAADLGILPYIIYRSRMDQKVLQGIYQNCDVFVLPSRYEIFGMVLLEAMYYGLPVITTYNGGSSTLMDDCNGIVLHEFDIQQWSDRIVSLLKNDKLREEIGTHASDTVRQHFMWDDLAPKFIEIYKRRLEKKSK